MLVKKKKVTKQEYKRFADLRTACIAAKKAVQEVQGFQTDERAERQKASAWLHENFPKTFVSKKPRPLKIGILKDIVNSSFPLITAPSYVKIAIGIYVRSSPYLRSMKKGAKRIDIDGKPSGFVTAQDAKSAFKLLTSRKKSISEHALKTVIKLRTSTRPILTLRK